MINKITFLFFVTLSLAYPHVKTIMVNDMPVICNIEVKADTVALNTEAMFVCHFQWPDSSGNLIVEPEGEWELDNLEAGATGSGFRIDSLSTDKTKHLDLHFYFKGLNPGPASVSELSFLLKEGENISPQTIAFAPVNFYILPPDSALESNKMGWLIVLVFFLVNALVLFIFAFRRNKE